MVRERDGMRRPGLGLIGAAAELPGRITDVAFGVGTIAASSVRCRRT